MGSAYKADLDRYGLIGWSGLLSRGSSSIEDRKVAISDAKSSLKQFERFTNVTDTSSLILKEATNKHDTDLFNDWIVIFCNQVYQGIEVMNTEIMVLIKDNLKQIQGHHIKEVFNS